MIWCQEPLCALVWGEGDGGRRQHSSPSSVGETCSQEALSKETVIQEATKGRLCFKKGLSQW